MEYMRNHNSMRRSVPKYKDGADDVGTWSLPTMDKIWPETTCFFDLLAIQQPTHVNSWLATSCRRPSTLYCRRRPPAPRSLDDNE